MLLFMPSSQTNTRQELDINLVLVLVIAFILTICTYLIAFPVKNSYIGTLLYSRGYTQYIVVFLASFVIATALNKYSKIYAESRILKRMWNFSENVRFDNHKAPELRRLRTDFAQTPSMVTARLSRIIGAYINSGSRKAVTELALDDSSFYLMASESSYMLPRILVWAIPLLGFIGTVLGISSAVNGFSGFLSNTAEIDKIKEGIGTVTSGLAIAFDTTLLALLLSVVVMIPLVLAERRESKLLLAMDVYINDKILPKLKETPKIKETQAVLDTDTIKKTITQTLADQLPTKEELIKPAEIYATEVAKQLTEQFISSFEQIQSKEIELIEGIKNINQAILQDRDEFASSYQKQQNLNQEIIEEIKNMVNLINQNNQTINQSLERQFQTITQELYNASNSLNNKVMALENVSIKISELNNLASVFDDLVRALDNVKDIQQILLSTKDSIISLEPTLQNLSKPRVFRFEQE